MPTTPCSVSKLAADLAKCVEDEDQVLFLLGAGASAAAGIPMATGIVNKVRTKRGAAPLAENESYEYMSEMDKISKPDRLKIFLGVCEDKKPTPGHHALASLVAHHPKSFGIVLTTNFDPLIENAITLAGKGVQTVVDHSAERLRSAVQNKWAAVIKLHGCIFGGEVRNTFEELLHIEEDLVPMLIARLTPTTRIVVSGYGGGDATVGKFLQMLENGNVFNPRNLYWCCGEQPDDWSPNKVIDLYKRDAWWVESNLFDELLGSIANKVFEGTGDDGAVVTGGGTAVSNGNAGGPAQDAGGGAVSHTCSSAVAGTPSEGRPPKKSKKSGTEASAESCGGASATMQVDTPETLFEANQKRKTLEAKKEESRTAFQGLFMSSKTYKKHSEKVTKARDVLKVLEATKERMEERVHNISAADMTKLKTVKVSELSAEDRVAKELLASVHIEQVWTSEDADSLAAIPDQTTAESDVAKELFKDEPADCNTLEETVVGGKVFFAKDLGSALIMKKHIIAGLENNDVPDSAAIAEKICVRAAQTRSIALEHVVAGLKDAKVNSSVVESIKAHARPNKGYKVTYQKSGHNLESCGGPGSTAARGQKRPLPGSQKAREATLQMVSSDEVIITFPGGTSKTRFCDLPHSVVAEWGASESALRFFNEAILGKFHGTVE
eukprot:m.10553 g.10553  ORF g.10553 m.10553 type:complete len:666 (-) comp7079_c0_seq1:13-2010(-)